MFLTSPPSVWKLFFAFAASAAAVLFLYRFIPEEIPSVLISVLLFLFIYAAIARRLTV